ncbi:MAG: hypothetical protein JWL65_5891 [Gammaproteobacteria bacterium]|nr:hypothetical protein [Gammaproteobacteria bacterium]
MQASLFPTMTSEDVRASRPSFSAIPIGSFEQHGAHLPLSIDTLIATAVAQSVCARYNGLLLPPISISCSHEHAAYPGTVSVSAPTLYQILVDLRRGILGQGIRFILLVNAHGGNYVVGNFVQEVNVERAHVLTGLSSHHWESAARHAGIQTSVHDDMHGGELETFILLHTSPELVRRDRITDWNMPERSLLTTFGMKRYAPNGGIIGFPSRASANKGGLLVEGLTRAIGEDLSRVLREEEFSGPQTRG